MSFGVQSTWATPNYREIGDTPVQEAQVTRASFNVALPGEAGSLALIWSGQRFRDSTPQSPTHDSQSGNAQHLHRVVFGRPRPATAT